MAALAVEVFEDCAPAAPEVVGEAVDGEPLAEDVDAVGDPELALPVEGDPPELLIELEVDGDPDEVPGPMPPPGAGELEALDGKGCCGGVVGGGFAVPASVAPPRWGVDRAG